MAFRETLTSLKVKGNNQFVNNEYSATLDTYSRALSLPVREGDETIRRDILANRSAAYAKLKRWEYSLEDANQAIKIDPGWFKGYVRRGNAYRALHRFNPCLEAYRQALALLEQDRSMEATSSTPREEPLLAHIREAEKERYLPRLKKTRPRIFELDIVNTPMDVVVVMAKGMGIHVDLNTPRHRITSLMAAYDARRYGDRRLCQKFLYFPCSDTEQDLTPRHITLDPRSFGSKDGIRNKITEIFKCDDLDSETIYSEDMIETFRGNEKGVPIGHMFKSWEIFVDDTCLVDKRPLNEHAIRVLRRPKTRGPIMFFEITSLKMTDFYAAPLCWNVVEIEFLESEQWTEMREDWLHLQPLYQKKEEELFERLGGVMVNLGDGDEVTITPSPTSRLRPQA